jgi:hypothetical protein
MDKIIVYSVLDNDRLLECGCKEMLVKVFVIYITHSYIICEVHIVTLTFEI